MNDIREVYGIGHKKANDLKRFYNIKTVRSLRLHIKKIPDIVTETQRTGLKYHNRIIPAMSRREATKHVNFIKKHLPAAIIAGSYRRELKKVSIPEYLSDPEQQRNRLEVEGIQESPLRVYST